MTGGDDDFRARTPVAWTFHRNTCRWTHNMAHPTESKGCEPHAERLDAPLVRLPVPQVPDDARLSSLLGERFSCRLFRTDPISLEHLAALAWAAYGVTGRDVVGASELCERTVPSAGGLYPLELYLLVRSVAGLSPGVYHYAPTYHALERVRDTEPLPQLGSYLFMYQPYIAAAPVVVVLTAVPARNVWKYGDRGYRYLLLEAGHVGQNLNLVSAALGLGSCNSGGFFDDELAGLLQADVEHEFVVYAVAVGHPAAGTRSELRAAPFADL